jgi:uncharacterized damage-inducible protein DinB
VAPRRADLFSESGTDSRTLAPAVADEHDTLTGFLSWQRETLALKCAGLTAEELARRAIEPSTLSLLGLVRHMADVERRWFRAVLAGHRAPARFSHADDGEFTGAVPDPDVVAEAWRAWREEVAFAEQFVAETPDLGAVGKVPDEWRGPVSLRWVLTHMIEEYARHNGHADLLRERIDGRIGV